MSLVTTCIGAWPKPGYVAIGNFAETGEQAGDTPRAFTCAQDDCGDFRATREAVEGSLARGIDPSTDGEQRRENHIHCRCRHLDGIGFAHLTTRFHRNGAAPAAWPA